MVAWCVGFLIVVWFGCFVFSLVDDVWFTDVLYLGLGDACDGCWSLVAFGCDFVSVCADFGFVVFCLLFVGVFGCFRCVVCLVMLFALLIICFCWSWLAIAFLFCFVVWFVVYVVATSGCM